MRVSLVIAILVVSNVVGCGDKGSPQKKPNAPAAPVGDTPEVIQQKIDMAGIQIQKLNARLAEYELCAGAPAASLEDLLSKADSGKLPQGLVQQSELLDPWGNPFKLTKTDRGPALSSMGPDGKDGTADDVKTLPLGP